MNALNSVKGELIPELVEGKERGMAPTLTIGWEVVFVITVHSFRSLSVYLKIPSLDAWLYCNELQSSRNLTHSTYMCFFSVRGTYSA